MCFKEVGIIIAPQFDLFLFSKFIYEINDFWCKMKWFVIWSVYILPDMRKVVLLPRTDFFILYFLFFHFNFFVLCFSFLIFPFLLSSVNISLHRIFCWVNCLSVSVLVSTWLLWDLEVLRHLKTSIYPGLVSYTIHANIVLTVNILLSVLILHPW